MKLKRLTIENFFSFEKADLSFPESGSFFVEGRNHDEGGSNGAGKSTPFEAMVWCFFGRTIRPCSPSHIVRRGAKKCSVCVVLQDDVGVTHTILRTRKGTTTTVLLNARPVSDVNVEKVLGHTFTSFSNSIVFGQGISKVFVESSDTERKGVLAQLLGLELYQEAARISKERYKTAFDASEGFRQKAESAIAMHQKAVNDAAFLREKNEGLLKERGEVVDAVRVVEEETLPKIQAAEVVITEQTVLETTWRERHQVAKTRSETVGALVSRALNAYMLASQRYDRVLSFARSLRASYAAFEELTEDDIIGSWLAIRPLVVEAIQQVTAEKIAHAQVFVGLTKESDALNVKRADIVSHRSRLHADSGRLAGEIARLDKDIAEMRGLTAQCPTCHQAIDSDYRVALTVQWDNRKTTAQVEMEATRTLLQETEDAEKKCNDEVLDVTRREREARDAEEELRSKLAVLQAIDEGVEQNIYVPTDTTPQLATKEYVQKLSVAHVKAHEQQTEVSGAVVTIAEELSKVQGVILSKMKEIAEYKKTVDAQKNQLPSIDSAIAAHNDLLKRAQADIDQWGAESERLNGAYKVALSDSETYRFWDVGFGNRGIISMLIGPAIEFLQSHGSHYLSLLSQGMKVMLDTKTEIKSGETREKISINVQNTYGADEYDGCSPGERKRANLAIILAERDLVLSRNTTGNLNLFVGDEVFESVDVQGAEKMCEIFSTLPGLIFVISHNESLRQHFNNVLLVEKKDGISTAQFVAA